MADDQTGERIAKVMARAGVASRRDAERLILAGRVAVNGVTVASPALDVMPADKVTLDGKPIDAPQPTRLWLYYKPLGLVTSEKDEKGRQTVFESLPDGMPRVMSVGRLDLNSEGLLLLTNDGELKRKLELPATGWLRKYRVRVNGRPTDATFDPLRRGIVIDGEDFQPMDIALDRQQGANAWLTVGLREGKNREVRRALAEVKLTVNRLIRVSYGPFRLNEMKPGEIVEVKAKAMREQLGGLLGGEERPARKPARGAVARPARGDRPPRAGSGPSPHRRSTEDSRPPRDKDGPSPSGYKVRRPHVAKGSSGAEDGRTGPPRRSWEKGGTPSGARGDGKPRGHSGGPRKPRAEGDRGERGAAEKPRFARTDQGPRRHGEGGPGKPRVAAPFRKDRDGERTGPEPARAGGSKHQGPKGGQGGTGKPAFKTGPRGPRDRRLDDSGKSASAGAAPRRAGPPRGPAGHASDTRGKPAGKSPVGRPGGSGPRRGPRPGAGKGPKGKG